MTVWAKFGKIDGRVLGGMQLGVLVQVLFEVVVTVWAHIFARSTAGC